MSLCSGELTEEGVSTKFESNIKFFLPVNASLSFVALFGNILILIALQKASSLHPPSKLLLSCLSTTDLCVGLISHPLYAVYLAMVTNKNWSGACGITEGLAHVSGVVLCLMRRVNQHIDCNKCGPTTGLNAGATIQTSCDFNTRSFICNIFVDSKLNLSPDLFVGQAHLLFGRLRLDFLVFNYFNLLLRKNLPGPSSSTSSNRGRYSRK